MARSTLNVISEYLCGSQFAFRYGFGTREALFSINVLAQISRDMSVDLLVLYKYACFIDFETAFDRVILNILIKTLRVLD